METINSLVRTSIISCMVLFLTLQATWGNAQRDEGKTNQIIEENIKIMQKHPNDVTALNNLGVALIQSGEYQKAVKYLTTAIQIKPTFAEAHYNLGLAYYYTQEYKNAETEYQRALDSGFRDYKVYYNLGLVLERQNNYDGAQKMYTEANNKKPTYPNAYYNLAEVYSKLKQIENAISCYENYLKYAPSDATDRMAVKNKIDSIRTTDSEPPVIVILEPLRSDSREKGLHVTSRKNPISIQTDFVQVTGFVSDRTGVSKVMIMDSVVQLNPSSKEDIEKYKFLNADNVVSFQTRVPLKSMENEIKITAADIKNNKQEVILKVSRIVRDTSYFNNNWAVVIGINNYKKRPWLNQSLNYAVNDAVEVTKTLNEKFGFKRENIFLLVDSLSLDQVTDSCRSIASSIKQATKNNIINAFAELTDENKVNRDDQVIIYFSGHGHTMKQSSTGGEMGFLIPEDGGGNNTGEYFNSCLPMEEVNSRSQQIPAKHVLFLVDACYSGLTAMPKGSNQTDEAIENFAQKTAKEIITAGTKDDVSYESSRLGHGVFTFQLLNGLKEENADLVRDGYITSGELSEYLQATVPDLARSIGGRQNPKYGYFLFGEGKFIFELPR